MPKFKRYEKYKDSGVEWIGEVPEHWEIKKLKNLARICNGGTPKSSEEKYWDGDIIWVTPDDLSQLDNKNILDSKRKITKLGLNESSATMVPEGSIILSCRAPIGLVGITRIPLSTNQGCKSIVPKYIDSIYLYYIFIAGKEFLKILGMGTTFTELSATNLKNLYIIKPSDREQKYIADFLDKKTSETDSLIADKEKLVKKLQEYKQSIITKTVTKGLDPNAKMKDSGVEWIGEVPEHWGLDKFKRYVFIQEGPGILAEDFRDNGTPLIRISGVKHDLVTLEGCNYLDSKMVERKWKHYKLSKGDLLISCSASVDMISEVGNAAENCIPYTGLIRLKPQNKDLNKQYLKYYIKSKAYTTQVELLKAGSTIKHYGPTHIKNFSLIIPSNEEQRAIVNYLDNKIFLINNILNNITFQLQKLQEYRQSLITYTVTGKIDVRDYFEEGFHDVGSQRKNAGRVH